MFALNPYPDPPIPTEAQTLGLPADSNSLWDLDLYAELDRFSPGQISRLPAKDIRSSAAELTAHILQSGIDPKLAATALIPSAGRLLAMIIDDRDSEEYQDLSGISYPARLAYQRIASLHEEMTPLLDRYSALFASLYQMLKISAPPYPPLWTEATASSWRGDVTLPRLFTFPRPKDLDYSHTFALDIFLRDVEYLSGDVQRGPFIHSISDGIVVAAGTDWLGYPRESSELSFLHGGISPKSGNGAIIYAPTENRYYLYFHLFDLDVEKGQIVRRGQPIGHGGNSGINARKKGGGDHLHIEIFDANLKKYLRNTQIIALLRDSAKRTSTFSPQ